KCARNKPRLAMNHEILRSALFRDYARNAAGECFDNDVAEGIRGARKNKDVGRGKSVREFEAREVSSEHGLRHKTAQFFQIGSVADTGEREAVSAQAFPRRDEYIQILLLGNPSDIEQHEAPV